jgi:uroporphyrinogen decarboxylase
MKSRERLLKVINGEITDRVPVSLFIHDEGNFLRQIYEDLDLENPVDCKYKLIDLERELGLDIILRMLHGMTPFWISYGGLNIDTETKNWKISLKQYQRGHSLVKSYLIKTPEREFNQEFSISEVAPDTFNYACTEKPIKNVEDLRAAVKYEPPMDKGYPKKVKEIVTRAQLYLEDDGITSIWVPGGSFNAASNLISLNTLYSLFLTDEPFFNRLIDFCIERTFPFIKAICQSGVDTVSIGGNVPGGFLGQKFYEKYAFPYEKKYIDYAKSFGVKTIYHNCGDIMALVDSYKELGSDVVEPFSPPPLGDGNLGEGKKRSEGKYAIIGNVDQVNVLQKGSIDMVREITRKTVEIGKVGGKYILQSADYLEYGTPVENLKAYVETGLKYGRY